MNNEVWVRIRDCELKYNDYDRSRTLNGCFIGRDEAYRSISVKNPDIRFEDYQAGRAHYIKATKFFDLVKINERSYAFAASEILDTTQFQGTDEMEIRDITPPKTVELKTIPQGKLFRLEGDIYQQVNLVGHKYCCRLKDGFCKSLPGETVVSPVTGYIQITGES
jgi:hypothetical protein